MSATPAGESIESLIARAQAGDPQAQCDLAERYEHGQSIRRDFSAALRWYEEALANRCAGWELVADRIARHYRDGIGTAQDWKRSLEMFELAARGYGYALYDVAWAHYWGLGVPRDQARAYEWHEKMWNRYQHGDAALAIAAQFANGAGVERDPAQCLRWLRLAEGTAGRLLLAHALAGGACGEPPNAQEAAMILAALRTRLPPDLAPTPQVAAAYWKQWQAAWNDDAPAQFALANARLGPDIKLVSEAERMRWLRKAADSGHAGAQYALGQCFAYKGHEGAIFAREAGIEWMRRAAAQGHAEAIRELHELGAAG